MPGSPLAQNRLTVPESAGAGCGGNRRSAGPWPAVQATPRPRVQPPDRSKSPARHRPNARSLQASASSGNLTFAVKNDETPAADFYLWPMTG